MAAAGQDSGRSHQSQAAAEPSEGILKTIMALRGLDISAASTFDFTLPAGSTAWPAPHYGPDSPHPQTAKQSQLTQTKRRQAPSTPTRPGKSRKPMSTPAKKARPAPSRGHGPIPKRDQPLTLLNLPGELRDTIYDVLAIHERLLYPQYRPVHTPGGRKVLRRYPQEPTLALVNRQLRREVLSMFYGFNVFVFRRSEGELLQSFSMTDTVWLTRWHCDCTPALSGYLRNIELRLDAHSREGPLTLTYKLHKTAEGRIDVTHDLADTGYCHCLEDEAVAEMRAHMVGLSDLVRVATVLSRKRKMKLVAFAKRDDDEGGLFKMPTATCLYCRKKHLEHVSAG
ncbi:hypothetical protein LTR36_004625 [Oleoguttula mirabilis]|uniref:Uncharacterized protein n=1 Tax=Oleoguttula mirabilis TaxID=1507867 RepID=A0AAV9JG67_9PEZI|nr:hypothetical protein LTR36_004625 [Oleoguttula mirabilis]